MPSPKDSLRKRLEENRLLVLPGAANALTARVIEDIGFEAVYITGAGVANTYLGVPDIGILGLSQMADHVTAIAAAVDIPIVVDGDTGFGNAVNVGYTVKTLEKAGASCIQLEDQTFPKRCGHFDGKDVIPAAEMVQKIHAAVDARSSEDFLIMARTDARAVLGIDEACERANLYREAGADLMFVEAPDSLEEMKTVAATVGGPKVINIVEGGRTPSLPTSELGDMGFGIALFANLSLLASVGAMQRVLGELYETGATPSGATLNATWTERQRLVRLDKYAALEAKYA